jgi:aldehyde dehydrogenase (NAD+)
MTTLSKAPHTASQQSIPDVVARLRATFRSGRTRPVEWRLEQLRALERMLAEREPDFARALEADLGRDAINAWMADLAPVTAESEFARKRLRRWTRRHRVGMPISAKPGSAWYQYEPLGTVLIIGPFNYPIHLVLAPLVGAIAAGNTAVIKPSENTPASSAAMAEIVPQYLDPDAVAVVEGGPEQTLQLIDQALDHVFFTGGAEVGKVIAAAAAKHLTPVTLELGGKSPVIVDADAGLDVTARRIVWMKTVNSGQTCIAPDYVLVDRSIKDPFLDALKTAIHDLTPEGKEQLPVVNSRHAKRLAALLDGAGGELISGGTVDVDGRAVELSVIVDPDGGADIMREEIFGPLLPIVTVDSLDDAIAHVQAGPKPLAVYHFGSKKASQQRVLNEISNGGTVFNHLMFQVLIPQLPFGGVGNSGTGTYHGEWGFQTFSHRKSVVRKPTRPDPKMFYPPYTKFTERILRRIF